MSRLYYEIHITVKAKEEEFWQGFRDLANRTDWRASKFDVDDVDAMHGQWFLSAREHMLGAAKNRTANTLANLRILNFEVLRWKIEDTILDSKHGDNERWLAKAGLPQ